MAETSSGRIWSWDIIGEGQVAAPDRPSPTGEELSSSLPGFNRYDSLAVEDCGNITVTTLRLGGST